MSFDLGFNFIVWLSGSGVPGTLDQQSIDNLPTLPDHLPVTQLQLRPLFNPQW